jgi:hypothetical protein
MWSEVRFVGFEIAAKGRQLFTFLGKFFSEPLKDRVDATHRNARHLCRLRGRQIKRETAQKLAKSGLGNLRKTKIAVNLLHGNMLTPLNYAFSS